MPEVNFPEEEKKRRLTFKWVTAVLILVIMVGCVSTMVVIEVRPYIGAQAAGHMRDIFGPQLVAGLETIVFRMQDTVTGLQYRFNSRQAVAPWESEAYLSELSPTPLGVAPAASFTPVSTIPISTPASSLNDIEQPKPGIADPPVKSGEQSGVEVSSPTPAHPPTPTPYHWQLSDLAPFGTLENEGVWQPYLFNREGDVVAYRTFLQPDPDRPYTIVAVVAFDLNLTRMHFVLGFNEPSEPDGPRGEGLVPEEDRQEGLLLAAFNGGFRAANGHYGAMADGIIALPPKDEIATIAIYRDGGVKIGEWGVDISDEPDQEAWRQNCRLIIQDGTISSRVYNNSITDWGATISNQIVTRRSGLGLDRGAEILYYFAGPSLSMPVLADTMLVSGVHNGMLLDINHFWVHFTAIHAVDGELNAEPLLPDDMIDHIDRYLIPSPVDFFYITALDVDGP